MFCFKDRFLFTDTRMSVDLSGSDGAVSEHLLNIPNIDVFFKQQRSKRMSEHMRSNMPRDLSILCIFINHVTHRLLGKSVVKAVDKKILILFRFYRKYVFVNQTTNICVADLN